MKHQKVFFDLIKIQNIERSEKVFNILLSKLKSYFKQIICFWNNAWEEEQEQE